MKYTNNFEKIQKYEFKNYQKFNGYLTPNQSLVRNWISPVTIYDSLLLFWKVGTGKTCGSISISEGFKKQLLDLDAKVIVLVKNSNIEKNFKDQLMSLCTNEEYITQEEKRILKSHNDLEEEKDILALVKRRINSMYTFITYGKFTNRNKSNIQDNFDNCVVIVDEVHNIINNENYYSLFRVLQSSYNTRLILLTATPIFNDIKEIAELSNLLNVNNKENILPIKNDLLLENYVIKRDSVYFSTDKLENFLQKSMKGKVSYLEVSSKKDFPLVFEIGAPIIPDNDQSVKVVYCQMSEYQYNLYKIAIRLDTETNNENEEDTRGLYKMSSSAATIVYPNNAIEKESLMEIENKSNIFRSDKIQKYSCKLKQLLLNVDKSDGKIFIYSNYVNNAGTELVQYLLLENGYVQYGNTISNSKGSFVLYNNNISIEKRERIKKIFNSPENVNGEIIKILIGSPAISEGITLKAVRQVHILEPSWNLSRIEQIVGRAVRKGSHSLLPVTKRNVKVFKYVSIYPDDTQTFFIDKEKYILSYNKEVAATPIYNLLKNSLSIESIIENSKNDTVDKSTYILNISTFEKENIKIVTNIILDLFKKWYIYSINQIIDVVKNIEEQIIHYCLEYLITNKINIIGMNEKEGHIYFINNKEYVQFKSLDDIDLFDFTIKENLNKITNDKVKEVKLDKKSIVELDLNNLSENIYGTYKNRSGIVDNKFRIIDLRKTNSEFENDDKRKVITGVAATSLDKSKLISIITYFGLNKKNSSELPSKELINIIKNYITENNLILN